MNPWVIDSEPEMTLDDDCIKVDVGSTQPWMYETEMWLGA
jgi:hypothetical protein